MVPRVCLPGGFRGQVADFGLARVLKDKNHIKTQTFGTVTHMPPELLAKGERERRGRVGPRHAAMGGRRRTSC